MPPQQQITSRDYFDVLILNLQFEAHLNIWTFLILVFHLRITPCSGKIAQFHFTLLTSRVSVEIGKLILI